MKYVTRVDRRCFTKRLNNYIESIEFFQSFRQFVAHIRLQSPFTHSDPTKSRKVREVALSASIGASLAALFLQSIHPNMYVHGGNVCHPAQHSFLTVDLILYTRDVQWRLESFVVR